MVTKELDGVISFLSSGLTMYVTGLSASNELVTAILLIKGSKVERSNKTPSLET